MQTETLIDNIIKWRHYQNEEIRSIGQMMNLPGKINVPH